MKVKFKSLHKIDEMAMKKMTKAKKNSYVGILWTTIEAKTKSVD